MSVFICLLAGSAIDMGTICGVRAAGDLAIGKPAIAISVLVSVVCASLVFLHRYGISAAEARRAVVLSYPYEGGRLED